MKGRFDDKGNIIVKIIVAGRKDALELDVLFDTGCSGYLVLPISVAVPLGLELIGTESVEYADGRMVNELVFKAVVKAGGKPMTIPVTLSRTSQPLVGAKMFENHSIKIDFKNKKVEIKKVK